MANCAASSVFAVTAWLRAWSVYKTSIPIIPIMLFVFRVLPTGARVDCLLRTTAALVDIHRIQQWHSAWIFSLDVISNL